MTKQSARAPRADAQRNRCALQTAAREVFAERGLDASLDEIARRAGIANATLYRHFPSRCDLVMSVFIEHFREYVEAARTAAEADDPWQGMCDFVRTACRLQADNRGLADLLTTTTLDDPELDALRLRARRDLGRAVKHAQQAGVLRPDFRPQDMVLILMANAGVVRHTADLAPSSSERLIALILDGLAADAATDGPPAPPERSILATMRAETAVRT